MRALFLTHLAQTSPAPPMLEIMHAEGIYISDYTEKKYIDFISGISVSATGHRHPVVVNAIKDQLDKYLHVMVYGEFIQGPQVSLAKKLTSMLPEGLDSVYFVNSGAEATEGALKLAKRVTGRTRIFSFQHAYHGSTHGALSVMGSEFFKNAFRPLLPDVYQLSFNSFDDLENIDSETACVIVETIQGEAGAIIPDIQWIRALRKKCQDTGALLILDEIQCGMGRTGSFTAFESLGIVPDILLLAKGLGGGLPIGAFISSVSNMSKISTNPVLGHITTFGGNAVCCAAALAVLHVLDQENLMDAVPSKEKIIRKKLVHPEIKEIRGKGLLLAAKFSSEEKATRIMHSCFEKGLITDWFLFAPDCLRIAPPLNITEEELSTACDIFISAIEEEFC